MKRFVVAAMAAAGLLAAAAPAVAEPRVGFSLHFGAPIAGGTVYYGNHYHRWHRPYRPYYYGRPWYAPPPVVYLPPPVVYSPPAVIAVPAQPPVYIEQGSAPAPQAQNSHWYYCADSRAYYPYVSECPGGWKPVPAQPAR